MGDIWNAIASDELTLQSADFAREDEGDDAEFYRTPRMVAHLDSLALSNLQRVIGQLVDEPRPAVLDLMASWDSHLPPGLEPGRMVGLGLNAEELQANPRLDERVIHDLNRDPRLPFADARFDVVLNVVSVDYLTKPLQVFAEVGRVLKPGGLLLVVFSNRFFPPKVTRVWREACEEERLTLVQDLLRRSGMFEESELFISKGLPRPADDRYADTGLPSDPLYVVYAERRGGDPARPARPEISLTGPHELQGEALAERKRQAAEEGICPYCGDRLRKWEVPLTPWTEWAAEHMYICFNDACSYYQRGYTAMARQGMPGISYRAMFNPDLNAFTPVPVMTPHAMKSGIVD